MLGKFSSYAFAVYMTLFWGSAVGVLIKSLIAKDLSKGSFGMYTYLVSLIVVMNSVFSLGLPDVQIKLIAEGKPFAGDFSRFALTIALLMLAVSSVIALATWGLIPEIYSITLLALGPVSIMPMANAIFRGELSGKRESSYRLLRRIFELGVLVALLFALNLRTDMAPAYATLASWYLATLYLLYIMRGRTLFLRPRRFLNVLRQPWLRQSVSLSGFLWVASIITILGAQADNLVVGAHLGFVELGEYGAALLFNGLIGQVFEALDSIFVSILPRGKYREIASYQMFISFNMLVIPLLNLLMLPFIPALAHLLLDESYTLVVPLFAVASFIFVFKSVELVNQAMFITIDRPKDKTRATIYTVAIYLPVLWLLVSRLHLLGAAFSFVIFWALYNAILMVLLKPHLPEHAQASARMTLLAFGSYLASVIAFFILGVFGGFVAPLLYVGLGQVLGLWDVRVLARVVWQLAQQTSRRLQRASTS